MAVQLDEQLLEVLACPCPEHAALTVGKPDDPEADALTCTSCGRVFPVQDGIPVLLLDEADTAPTGQDDVFSGQDTGSIPGEPDRSTGE